jgi:fluoride exporter
VKDVLVVAAGGAMGAVARYKMSGLVLHRTLDWTFPAATFAVNVLGCLVAGALSGLVERHDLFGPHTRLLLFTGLLGGFTTFSAFGMETVHLLRRGESATAALYVALSVLAGLLAFYLAFAAVPHSQAR